MKTGSITKKIIGGKLVRVDVEIEDHKVRAKLTGDFFLHPEDTLEMIVEVLDRAALPPDHDFLVKEINRVMSENQAQLIGASADDIVTIFEEAVVCASE